MESLDKILKHGRVVRKNLARDHNHRLREFIIEVPGLGSFLRSTLNTRIIDASFFEVDEVVASSFATHDVMVALSASHARNWHFGYQRTLTGHSQSELLSTFYRFYLVPAKNPVPVMNFRKFARRVAFAQRQISNQKAVAPLERISFARLRPHERCQECGFRIDYIRICHDEASDIPVEFMKYVSSLGPRI